MRVVHSELGRIAHELRFIVRCERGFTVERYRRSAEAVDKTAAAESM